MKNILQSSVLFLGFCFFAGKVNAQLASDTPAMTPAQVTNLLKEKKAIIPVRPADSTTIAVPTIKTIAERKRPAIPDEDKKTVVPGATKPVSSEPTPLKEAEMKSTTAPAAGGKSKE